MSEPQQPQEPTQEQSAPKTLYEAILRVQGELPKVSKDATNPHFKKKYTTIDALHDAILGPVLNKNGLTWMTFPGFRPETESPTLGYELCFAETEERKAGEMLQLAGKDDPQGQGAALTYARRQALQCVLGITADDDDDGNKAAESRRESQQRQRETRDPNRPMPEDSMTRMAKAAADAGLDLVELGREAGVAEGQTPTIAQGQAIKLLIEAAKAEGGTS